MEQFTISLNQLVEASEGTQNARRRIVSQNVNVNKILVVWYRLAKSRIKKYFRNVHDVSVLTDAIEAIKQKPEIKKNAANEKRVSIEAIIKVMEMRFDQILDNPYEVITPEDKTVDVEGIRININPDIVFRYVEDDVTKVGAIKFHVAKTKPFNLQQSRLVANLLKQYLEEKVVKEGEVVDERLCWAYDIFAERLLHADKVGGLTKIEVQNLCKELKKIYAAL